MNPADFAPAPQRTDNMALLQNMGMGPPPSRRPRRSRRFAPGHWRARLATLLDRVSNWLNPLGAP